ncbi:methyl-accepting chemotaxis protein [Alteromonas ponticola]|uniref:Methyl-accepting chemotaxis protein n=1 Tax=Alteromonas ponticola TaxID=2720613 RepID=A0ABX1R270_9ALTE|nr:methyl-accepting chemotaxis protein [Alteromonas ponticola]NMH60569.1 methyl-accepting chemotaxis protein [Alteromonas ponticola]
MLTFVSSLSIKTRLALGFGIILALLALLTIQGIRQVNAIDRTLAEMTDINSVKQRYAINFRGSVHDRAIAVRDVAIAANAAQVSQFEKEIRSLERFYVDSENKMDAMLSEGIKFSAQEKDILRRIDEVQRRTLPLVATILTRKKAGEDVSKTVLESARPAFIEWLNTINEFIDYQEEQNQIATPKARDVAGSFQSLMLILSACAIALSIAVGFLIARSLRLSLGGEPYEAQNAIKLLAEGDLTMNIDSRYHGSIMDSLDSMSDKLTSIVKNIVNASNDLSKQVSEVTEGSGMVLQSAKKQASLTSDTADKLGSMRSSIDQVSQIASRTEENSGLTVQYAMQGRQVVISAAGEIEKIANTVNATVTQIKLLEENTKKISGIASVISSISEQTNLLALNAAIEAARAGESGRGFAVVADEVRQLAKRTGEATSQIETMINEVQTQTAASVQAMETTQPQVENGKAQITKATELLENIEVQANDSLVRVKEVAQAAAKQVSVVTDVNEAMNHVAAMSDSTIESMNNNDKATKKLSKLSLLLKQEVSFFKV